MMPLSVVEVVSRTSGMVSGTTARGVVGVAVKGQARP